MAKRIKVAAPSGGGYDIVIQHDFSGLAGELEALGSASRKLCLITDSRVGELYGEEVSRILTPHCREVHMFTFPAGESHKTLGTVQDAYRFLIQHRFERKDLIVALGGGVTGDLAGYTAASYLRGVDFIQIPTTLLAQVDSSIGGKTGVDFDQYKNMVGAFHMPRLVYMNLSTLRTLDGRQYACGLAEILKHGLIKDVSYFEWLIGKFSEINSRDMDTVEEMVYKSCLIKKMVVERDPLEQGERALLNFGHTIGHAIEKASLSRSTPTGEGALLHGECVALGCVAAAYISWKRGMLSKEEYYEVRDMFVPFSLPISLDGINAGEVLRFTKSDKKMEGGAIKFILLRGIGKAVVDRTVSEEEMRAALGEIVYNSEEHT